MEGVDINATSEYSLSDDPYQLKSSHFSYVDGTTALMVASATKHNLMTKFLLENGADIDDKDGKGWSSLDHSASVGDVSTITKYSTTNMKYNTLKRVLI